MLCKGRLDFFRHQCNVFLRKIHFFQHPAHHQRSPRHGIHRGILRSRCRGIEDQELAGVCVINRLDIDY